MVSPFPVDPADDSHQRDLINLPIGFAGTWRISSWKHAEGNSILKN